MQFIAMLGRQPAIGIAELERVHGDVHWFGHDSAIVNCESFDIERLGGTIKAGMVVSELTGSDWRKTSMELVRTYARKWRGSSGKITVGISAYGFTITVQEVKRTGHILKSKLKESGVSLRVVPNEHTAISSASSHHNKLGLSPNKVELMIIRGHNGKVVIAESTGSQNITALARRDQARPARDAFVGMLPPKLAQIVINLAVGNKEKPLTLLDPFCGTGVLLQESVLMGYDVIGTDLSEKMVSYSNKNLEWLQGYHHINTKWRLFAGDATDTKWPGMIDAVAAESYLGQPFSAPPSDKKLAEVRNTCDTVVGKFLQNIAGQIESGTPLCIAVPAWNDGNDRFTHLHLVKKLDTYGYKQIEFKNVNARDLLYFRPGQVVARELLVFEKQ